MNKRSVPRDRKQGTGTRRNNLEKDFSTKQHLQKQNARVQAPHEDKRRTAGPEEKAGQGKEAADCLIMEHPDLRFPRSVRVRSRTDYLKVQRSGKKVGGRFLIILSMNNGLPASRFGITVSRKTGNAVTRNRVKRRIRELQRLSRDNVVAGKDIVVIATRKAPGADFEGLKGEYKALMTRAGLISE
jgi:ribonuclease P protein component